MKSKIVIPFAALVLCLSTTTFAQAGPGVQKERKNDKREFVKPNAGHKSFLTEEQRAAVKEINLQSIKETQPLRDKLNELKARQRTLINEANPNMSAIYTNIDEIAKLESQIAKIKVRTKVEMASKLTEEQRLMMSKFDKPGKKGKNKPGFHKRRG